VKLTFQRPHLSITSFPECELPPFTVLTGLNGSGKTHLLQAIKGGQVRSSVAANVEQDIRLFDWNTIVPNNADAYDSHMLLQAKQVAFAQFNQYRRNILDNSPAALEKLNLAAVGLHDISEIANTSAETLGALLGDSVRGNEARAQIDVFLNSIWDQIISTTRSPPHHRGGTSFTEVVKTLKQRDFSRLFSIDQSQFSDAHAPAWGTAEPFRQSFAQLFVAYRDLMVENRLHKLAFEDGETSVPPLSKEQFVERYNDPPWEFVNDVFEQAGLDFEIDAPQRSNFGQYKPMLTKRSSAAGMEFTNLSSGEKVLMSFALCLYYAQDSRQISKYPRLLLLDEVDAPLHPSMCRMLVRTICDTLIAKHGLHVVLTTHSPSTVALVPDESIHLMQATEDRIQKIGRGAALNILTQDVPTVSLDFEGRRQVMVESTHDAIVYDRIYQGIKARLRSERSLEFVGAGRTPSAGSGCDQVTYIVQSLVNAGNKSVFGLIDWDYKNDESDRLKVVGHKRRHSLENCIFDPLLIAIHVTRLAQNYWAAKGLSDVTGYMWFKDRSAAELQNVVNLIVKHALSSSVQNTTAELKYLGGMKLETDSAYLTMRGHNLEAKLLAEFPPLQRDAGSAGKLMKCLAESIVVDFPEYIPSDLVDCLSGILSAPMY
jgi:ABC-type transport system involved in cytochrome c biogenesis ATPase subunit